MSSKLMRMLLCFLLSSVVSTGVGLAAEVTPQIYVDFVGTLQGTSYELGSREIDKTGTFAAHHGTEIVSGGLGVLSDADGAGQESFQFDASAWNHNATTFAGTSFIVEAVFTPTTASDSMAPIIDIGGQCYIRFHDGLSAGSWNGSTDSVNNNIQTIPGLGETHHYAVVYAGGNTIDYYMDGEVIFQSTNGSPQSITKWISWGNIRHTSVDGGRQLRGEYDAVAFSTFSGVFDPTTDFILPKGPVPATLAFDPKPAHEADDVPVDTPLGWAAGISAVTHDVYLGTSLDDVNSASTSDPRGVLVSPSQADTVYDADSLLAYGQTYYWRIDEVNGAPDYTTFKGQIWSFTAEPYAYPITGLTVKASAQQASSPASRTIDGSGLDEFDQHGTDLKTMWVTPGGLPAWIEYTFDKAYKLHELWVWNANSELEQFMGFGAKDVTIEYSTDGETWSALENVPEFAQGTGKATYTANTVVDLGEVMAKYVRLTINDNWGATAMVSLGEVRFFYTPVQAFEPDPADEATEVDLGATLNWRPGREAASHEVYFGTDADAVAEGTVAAETVTEHQYTPASMDFGTTYYWRVDEVGDTGTYQGDVWSFTAQEFEPVDDFESYNDDIDAGTTIWQTWTDGVTTEASGSQVGYTDAPFAEKNIVHGGAQSMPLSYDNATKFFFSEASRQFDPVQNWTGNGADQVGLWIRGYPAITTVEVTETSGKMDVTGAGTDIWDNSDEFTYAFRTLTGDGTLVARVVSNGAGSQTWAKGGVMIRDSLNGGSAHAMMVITASGGNGASFQYRAEANGESSSVDSGPVVAPPYWVKIQRLADSFTGYVSADGKTWAQIGTTAIAMTDPVHIGLCVTSHEAGVDRTYHFDSITTTGTVAGAWQGVVIDNPQYNAAADMHLTIEDSAGASATVTSATAVTAEDWTRWTIPMSDFAGVNFSKVKKMVITIGDKSATTAGGAGMVFIDDIGFGHAAE